MIEEFITDNNREELEAMPLFPVYRFFADLYLEQTEPVWHKKKRTKNAN